MNPRLKTTILIILVSLFVGPHAYGNPKTVIDGAMTDILLTDNGAGSLTVETKFSNDSKFKGNALGVHIHVLVRVEACTGTATSASLPQIDCSTEAQDSIETINIAGGGTDGSATVTVAVTAGASYVVFVEVVVSPSGKGKEQRLTGFRSITMAT